MTQHVTKRCLFRFVTIFLVGAFFSFTMGGCATTTPETGPVRCDCGARGVTGRTASCNTLLAVRLRCRQNLKPHRQPPVGQHTKIPVTRHDSVSRRRPEF